MINRQPALMNMSAIVLYSDSGQCMAGVRGEILRLVSGGSCSCRDGSLSFWRLNTRFRMELCNLYVFQWLTVDQLDNTLQIFPPTYNAGPILAFEYGPGS